MGHGPRTFQNLIKIYEGDNYDFMSDKEPDLILVSVDSTPTQLRGRQVWYKSKDPGLPLGSLWYPFLRQSQQIRLYDEFLKDKEKTLEVDEDHGTRLSRDLWSSDWEIYLPQDHR